LTAFSIWIGNALSVHGIAVIEIFSATDYRNHKLTPFAHVEGTYRAGTAHGGNLFSIWATIRTGELDACKDPVGLGR
jgi:hypothetical protein